MLNATRRTLAALAATLPLATAAVHSQPNVQVGRYSTYTAAPSIAQRYPLAKIVNVGFARNTDTVGAALLEVLQGSGYAFVHGTDPRARALLQKPLPDVHRELGPMNRATALQVLVGEPYQILVSDVRREVCIALKPDISPRLLTPLDARVDADRPADPRGAPSPGSSRPGARPARDPEGAPSPVHPLIAGGGYARK